MRESVGPSLDDSLPLRQKTSAHVMFSSEKPIVIDIPSVRTSMMDLLFYTEAEICKMQYEAFLEEEGGSFGTLTSSGKDMFEVGTILVEDDNREEQGTPTATTTNMDRQDKKDRHSSASIQPRVREHRAQGSSRDRASRSSNRSGRSPNPKSPPRRENSAFHNQRRN
jgi:hypothetical protein